MGLGENIFMTAEEVMDRWGIVDPINFLGQISFEPFSEGKLAAYEKHSREPANYLGIPEGEGKIDFSEMVDCEDRLDPSCLKYLLFKFCDVLECEKKNPDLLQYAAWAIGYRQEKAQTAKQAFDQLNRRHEESVARNREFQAEQAKFWHDINESGDETNAEGVENETKFIEEPPNFTEKDGEDVVVQPSQAVDESGRYSLTDEQVAHVRCRVVAELILKERPEVRICHLINSPYITDLACKFNFKLGKNTVEAGAAPKPKTLRKYLKDLRNEEAVGTLPAKERNKEIQIVVNLIDKSD
jgi:hypothetical protein